MLSFSHVVPDKGNETHREPSRPDFHNGHRGTIVFLIRCARAAGVEVERAVHPRDAGHVVVTEDDQIGTSAGRAAAEVAGSQPFEESLLLVTHYIANASDHSDRFSRQTLGEFRRLDVARDRHHRGNRLQHGQDVRVDDIACVDNLDHACKHVEHSGIQCPMGVADHADAYGGRGNVRPVRGRLRWLLRHVLPRVCLA